MSIFDRKSDAEGRTLDIQTLNRAYAIGAKLKALREAEQWLEQMQGEATLSVTRAASEANMPCSFASLEMRYFSVFGSPSSREANPVKSISLATPIALYAIQQQIAIFEAELRSLGIAV